MTINLLVYAPFVSVLFQIVSCANTARWRVLITHLNADFHREGVNSAYQQYKIQQMLELGAEVVVASESGLTLESATQLLQEASRMGQLGGVFIINMVCQTESQHHWRSYCDKPAS